MNGKRFLALLATGVVYFTYFAAVIRCSTEYRKLKCLVCTRLIEEIHKNVSKVDSKLTINVGGFRLDDEGNYAEKTVPYSKSEILLTEVMENVCDKMDDYVRATFKKTGELTVIPLVTNDGQMNPIMSEVDVVQDSDLNKSLKYYCQDMVDEYDEIFVQEFSSEEHHNDLVMRICGQATQLCENETIQLSRLTSDEL